MATTSYSNMKNSKSNASSNQSKKEVENDVLDNNSHSYNLNLDFLILLNYHRQKTSFLITLPLPCLLNFQEPWFLGSSSSVDLPTQQELLLDLPSINTTIAYCPPLGSKGNDFCVISQAGGATAKLQEPGWGHIQGVR